MHKLALYPVSSVDELAWPEASPEFSLNSPATEFFTDFSRVEPLIIDQSVHAIEARKMMIRTHVRMKLVVDEEQHFAGVISAEVLSEQNIMERVVHGAHREDLLVSDLMIRKRDLQAFRIDEVEHASIGEVVNLLKDNHQQHCLVIDAKQHKIRGIFSASDISRKLRLPVNIQDQSSFYRVFSEVS